MAKLLYIESSPRKGRAASIAVARYFLDAYRDKNPNDALETLDLWATNLPRFDGSVLEAKYAIVNGQPHTAEQSKTWQAIVKLAEHFKAADKYLFRCRCGTSASRMCLNSISTRWSSRD